MAMVSLLAVHDTADLCSKSCSMPMVTSWVWYRKPPPVRAVIVRVAFLSSSLTMSLSCMAALVSFWAASSRWAHLHSSCQVFSFCASSRCITSRILIWLPMPIFSFLKLFASCWDFSFTRFVRQDVHLLSAVGIALALPTPCFWKDFSVKSPWLLSETFLSSSSPSGSGSTPMVWMATSLLLIARIFERSASCCGALMLAALDIK
mmetsp:Transcript_47754/g.86005  ORF Transcript_47754/g.86005 Transcript_47754/m.86005 type:complete len:205 (-) Transcript_47754:1565-2179(-)